MNKILLILVFLLTTFSLFAQQKEIKGVVTDAADKSTLPGVTIRVKGTDRGVSTDFDGNYVIMAESTDILIFSFVGMKSEEIKVGDRTKIDIALSFEAEMLEDVVVIGYGVRKKGTVSGAVSTLKEDVLDVPVVSFDQALQGQVAGLSVMTSSGAPGAASSVRIRGVNSINAGTDPLYIMDGIAITAGDFSSLNPNDIENISVLKDASSTSIYGARAANGVIVITTKRGKAGERTNITYSGKVGFSAMAYGEWNMMNTKEKLDYEEMVGLASYTKEEREELEKVNTNWKDVLYRDHAPMTSHDLSISGGGERSNYFISFGYLKQDGISISSSLERYNMRLNLESRATDWLKVGVNTTLGYTNDKFPYGGDNSPHNPAFAMFILEPYYNPYNEDGSVADHEFKQKYGDKVNPLATAENIKLRNNTVKLIASGFLEVKPISELTLRTQLGVEGYDYRNTRKVSPDFSVQNGNGVVNEDFVRNYNLTLTNLATYLNTFDVKHNVTFMVGQEALVKRNNGFGGSGSGYTDSRLMLLGNTPNPDVTGGSLSTVHYLSFFGRAEYNYDYKYYLDFSLRGDGSSLFGEDNKWATFWSVGAMWDVTKEDFMKSVSPITNLQVSFNVGSSGNSSIPNYAHLAVMSGGTVYDGNGGYYAAALGNSKLTWEKILSYNANIKVDFFDRIRIGVDWYLKKTTDMLMDVPVSMVSGFSSGWQNIGAMENSGFDFDFNADVITTQDFSWNLATNVSYNKNKITELYGGKKEYVMPSTGLKLTVGKDAYSYYLPRFAGVDPLNGDALWYTKEGEITNQYSDNLSVLHNKSMIAPWTGGFTNTFKYKGVTLQAFFSWVSGRYMNNSTRVFTESNGLFNYNQSRKMFNAWTPSNRYTDVPKYGNVVQQDDRLLEDASFLRLKNLTVSWDVPQDWVKRWTNEHITGVRIYGQGQNLWTKTKYSGLDPEYEGNNQLGAYPAAKTFILGVDVKF